ncbi:hypothetical protein [Nocardiopsis oceani]
MDTLTKPRCFTLLAPVAALSLLLSACGSSDEGPASPDEGGPEAEEHNEEPDEPSLGDPGILVSDCSDGTSVTSPDSLSLTLFSAEDGSEILETEFAGEGIEHGESDALSHGRAVQPTEEIDLPVDCTILERRLVPEHDLLLATYEEEVSGNSVTGFGALSPDGTFTALSPEQELSDFDAAADYLNPVYDAVEDRVVFVEQLDDDSTFQAMDLENGEVTELGTCGSQQCENASVPEGSGTPVIVTDVHGSDERAQASPDGSSLIVSENAMNSGSLLTVLDLDAMDDTAPLVLDREVLDPEDGPGDPVVVEPPEGVAAFVDEGTVLMDDNELSVWEFDDATLADFADEWVGEPEHSWEGLPTERSLIPEGPRTNSHPAPSPDGSEVAFRSESDTGETSLYTVPFDGSDDPAELTALSDDSIVHSWH